MGNRRAPKRNRTAGIGAGKLPAGSMRSGFGTDAGRYAADSGYPSVGIDIGNHGCISVTQDERVIRCLPVTNSFGTIVSGVNSLQATGIPATTRIVIEEPAGMRGRWNRQDLVNRAFGFTIGLLSGSGFINIRSVNASKWTGAFGLHGGGKESHIALANELYPDVRSLIDAIGDGAADALLLAFYAAHNWEDLEPKPPKPKKRRRRRKK